ncbi:MAG: P1 family peptidase [Hyphomicrobiaceae bacterium]
MRKAGINNLITDVPGLAVGNADDPQLRSGVTVVLPASPAIAAVDVRGGGPGTRETDALGLGGTVDEVHGLVLSGGSAFGLGAATGVQNVLRAKGIGFEVGTARVPIVPGAILFDLMNGGDKEWPDSPPYEQFAERACHAANTSFELGTAGAGYGATTARYAGGLGSASLDLGDGLFVGALAAVNPLGCVTLGDGPHVWAAPLEINGEFGGHGWPENISGLPDEPPLKGGRNSTAPGENTTLCVVATNACLTKRQCWRLAVMAQTGLARAIFPVHTPLDGDVVFALSTCGTSAPETTADLARLGAHAATTLARAITRGVCEAGRNGDDWPGETAWSARFGA